MSNQQPPLDVEDRAPVLLRAIELTYRQPDDLLRVDAVSFSVAAGEIYCLLGASGAGKTTILHCFLGLLKPTAGRVFVGDTEVTPGLPGTRRHLLYIPSGAALYQSLTAFQNVRFFSQVDGTRRSLDEEQIRHAMRRVGIPERSFDRPIRELRHHVAMSVWLAVSLLTESKVLLLDEPTVGLDLSASSYLQDTLLECRRLGKALLVATGDVLLAGRLANRVAIMKEGRKTIELTRAELMDRALPDLYLEYMGRPLTAPRM